MEKVKEKTHDLRTGLRAIENKNKGKR